MNYFCIQTTTKGCGFACIKMLIANTLNNPDYLYLEEELDHNNYTFNDLIKIAKKYNVYLDGYEITNISKKTLLTPCIGLINQDNKKHYIYIYKLERNYLYYYDPIGEEKVISVDEFEQISDKKFLLIKSFDKEKIKFKNKKVVDIPLYNLSQYAISLIQCISIFLLSFLTKEGSMFLFISIGVFLLSLFLSHYSRVYFLKLFDKKYIDPILEKELANKNDLNMIFEYKKLYFSYANKLLMHSLILGFSIFILSVNDIKTLIGIVIILLVKIIVYKLEKSKNLPIKCEIINLENTNTLQGYKNANNKAYEYLENKQFYSLLITITIMFVTFIICLLNKSFGQFVIIFMLLKIVDEKLDKIKILDDQKLLFIKHECHYKALINKKEK